MEGYHFGGLHEGMGFLFMMAFGAVEPLLAWISYE